MKCFKDLKRECNPRKCDKICYIKDKYKGVDGVFESDNAHDRQIEVNCIALDIFQELCNSILDEVVFYVYDETKMYPNIIAISEIRERIQGINSL